MASSSQKVYQAWPTDPPTYEQVNDGATQSREWNYSLFDCCSPGTLCLMACCLPCLAYGKTQARVQDPSLRGFSYVNSSCAIWTFLSFGALQWISQTITRGELRKQHGIEGSCCGDCCVSTFCGCCAIIQEEKEAELRSRPNLAGYQRTPAMGMN
ncbi:unnamed protein product [Penicillium olsonii]|nr:unnamed protein product [Penicillium olsonii]CAG7922448.1 unnamed protein product [Penicillium olsonii]CAG8252773.1 unnamed protein product [Penicillium olsonii]